MIGETFGGKYAIVRLLGEGGMGAVYEARHTGTGRRLAVKVITGQLAEDPRLVTRFEREARAAGAIESEHIVQVVDVGRDEQRGAPFLAMELLVGEDLAQVLARLGPVPADLGLRIGVQACLGLEKAHAAGIVHRDIKPANLFLAQRESGELVVKLLDFGIAKVEDGELGPDQKKRPLTQTGAILGSPLYMSPEQARNRGRLDHRTDLWSLGIVIYQALAGRTPLEHVESLGDFIVAVCTTPVTPLRELAPWVDPMVAQAVERALAIDAAQRYQSAAEMREALAVFLPEGASLRPSMLVRAPEAGPAPPPPPAPPDTEPSLEGAATVPGTPLLPAPGTPIVDQAPGTPSPTLAATVPGQPIEAAFAPATPAPPPAPAPVPPPTPPHAVRRGRGAVIAGLLVVATAGGIGGVHALGRVGDGKPETREPAPEPERSAPAAIPPAPAPVASLASLSGSWWSEAGVVYDGVVAGDTVELRVHDPEHLLGQGYTAGEAAFVLRPIEGDPHDFHVEARVRPAPPPGLIYDPARSAKSCVASFSHVGGKALRAVPAIDRLVVQTARVEPPASVFERDGIRVVGCAGLAEAPAVEVETLLGRTPVARSPRWVAPHDAGSHDGSPLDAGVHDAGVHDAGGGGVGSPCESEGQCSTSNCFNHRCLPTGKGFGGTCAIDAQCQSHRCVASMCK